MSQKIEGNRPTRKPAAWMENQGHMQEHAQRRISAIRECLKERGIGVQTWAEAAGIRRPTVYRILEDPARSLLGVVDALILAGDRLLVT